MTEIEVPDIAADEDFKGVIRTLPQNFSPLTWTLPCRLADSEPGNWTINIRVISDLQVSHRDRLEPGAVSTVPLGLSLLPCGNLEEAVEDDTLRVVIGLEWATCEAPDVQPVSLCQGNGTVEKTVPSS